MPWITQIAPGYGSLRGKSAKELMPFWERRKQHD
jgi:hypothetical protein